MVVNKEKEDFFRYHIAWVMNSRLHIAYVHKTGRRPTLVQSDYWKDVCLYLAGADKWIPEKYAWHAARGLTSDMRGMWNVHLYLEGSAWALENYAYIGMIYNIGDLDRLPKKLWEAIKTYEGHSEDAGGWPGINEWGVVTTQHIWADMPEWFGEGLLWR